MSNLNTAAGILEFAIEAERAAAAFYERLSETAKSAAMKATLIEFAEEERGHERKLLAFQGGKAALGASAAVRDLKISEYTRNPVEIGPNSDYQTVLLYAMHQEKLAFRLYTDLAGRIDDAEAKRLLLGLAQEEAKHKLRFEVEYDENVLKEN
jgi:rubrerythrin